jgi:hypothetical protein
MSMVRLMGRKADLPRTLAALQDVGTLHLCEPVGDTGIARPAPSLADRRRRRDLERALADVEGATAGLAELGALDRRGAGGRGAGARRRRRSSSPAPPGARPGPGGRPAACSPAAARCSTSATRSGPTPRCSPTSSRCWAPTTRTAGSPSTCCGSGRTARPCAGCARC